jgi:hypothetical protein
MRGRIYQNSENFVGIDAGQLITAGGEVAGAIISSLASVKDAKLRRQYQERIAVLDAQQQRELNTKLLKAKTDTDRLRILADSLNASNIARIQAFNKRDLNLTLYIIGGIAILGSAFFIYKKFKK